MANLSTVTGITGRKRERSRYFFTSGVPVETGLKVGQTVDCSQMGQIRVYFRSIFRQFWLGDLKNSRINMSDLGLILPIFAQDLTSQQ